MKKKKKNPYSSSEQTRKKIITAAQYLFAKEGFAAASISTIAAKAKINQSLIYHHFGSKELLWKAVKQELVESIIPGQPPEITDLDGFLREFFVKRLHLFADHPELSRILDWQKMQNNREKLAGGTHSSPDQWRKTIGLLQKKQAINPSLDPKLVSLLIESLTSGAVSEDYEGFLKNHANRKKYIEFALGFLTKALSFSSANLDPSACNDKTSPD